jgi:hypothetical protein
LLRRRTDTIRRSDLLLGRPVKAKKNLGGVPEVEFPKLVR